MLAHTDISHQGSGPTIGFTDREGVYHLAPATGIAALLSDCVDSIELVMLAGCKSDQLGVQLAEAGLRQIQCWETLVLDKAAPIFDIGFLKHWLLRGECMLALQQGIADVEGIAPESRHSTSIGARSASVPLYQCVDPSDREVVDEAFRVRSNGLLAVGVPRIVGDPSCGDGIVSAIRRRLEGLRFGFAGWRACPPFPSFPMDVPAKATIERYLRRGQRASPSRINYCLIWTYNPRFYSLGTSGEGSSCVAKAVTGLI